MTAQPWTAREIAWAKECVRAGDTLSELTTFTDRTVLDVARAIGVDGPVPLSGRWMQHNPENPRPWCGSMLKEVILARVVAGEDPQTLAAIAGVCRSRVYQIMDRAGVRKRRAAPYLRRAA